MKAVISSKFRKGMLIALFVYEAIILFLGILGFIVGYSSRYNYTYDVNRINIDWWHILSIFWSDGTWSNFYADHFFLVIFIIIVFMLPPFISLLINRRKRKLTELTANEKEIVGSYTGFIPIAKITLKMPIEKIDNIAAVNSVFYWFTGKTIRISSTSSVIKIPFVVNADEIATFISEAIEKAKGRPVKPAAEHDKSPIDIADSLKKFAELRDAGIITEEEFTKKKNELLGKM